ncbi:chaplin [Streptomyces sp. DSM 44915]|uniref:Chaplin n=1 Tax=Streptomyces chisholmiae TaxID=3075540 RepID=A0ABU2JJQ7_9ACTN|nr:chaplin [Streptomyces sp. DSM 44915]MDT0265215.1 chaplin [Streptomyces sp. DSM 44915]
MNTAKKAALVLAATGAAVGAAAGSAAAHSGAIGGAAASPGVVSGNNIQAPIHLPVNVDGNSVNVVGLLNPTFGNTSVNH